MCEFLRGETKEVKITFVDVKMFKILEKARLEYLKEEQYRIHR